MQERMGSRERYEGFDLTTNRADRLGRMEIEFLRQADHFYQATVSETGWPYVQHRGGPTGFLNILDPKTLAFADFRGNVQYLSVGWRMFPMSGTVGLQRFSTTRRPGSTSSTGHPITTCGRSIM